MSRQTFWAFAVLLVDNSGSGNVRRLLDAGCEVEVIENDRNAGFGAAMNQGIRATTSEYVALLNDDAVPAGDWLEEMVRQLDARPDAGMCAPRILLAGSSRLDSAGMLLCADGSSKQRGQNQPAAEWTMPDEALFPSGCAALLRRAMLEETGLFDERFFLYCEDTDLGLRARRRGWTCLYAPAAVVEHGYSRSAGRASSLKAYLVERNRLRVLLKNLPVRMLAGAPWVTLRRYFWHWAAARSGHGAAGEFAAREGTLRLAWYVLKAHLALIPALPDLLRERAVIRRAARLTDREFLALLLRHSIGPREIATR